MDWQLIVPGEDAWRESVMREAWEVRLRPGQPVTALGPGGVWRGSHTLTAEEVTQAAQALTGHSLAARRAELEQGFVPLPGGHRLGVCGGWGGEISSLCVRMVHEIKGAASPVFSRVRGRSALIVGPPGAGKTTLLRDLIRLYSQSGLPVGVADERGEIAACWGGAPQLDVGPLTDVVTGMEKDKALLLLIRSMGPRIVAADEIGGERDAAALSEALRCGVTVLAAAHGSSLEDVQKRRGMAALLGPGGFGAWVGLSAPGEAPRVHFIDQEGEGSPCAAHWP